MFAYWSDVTPFDMRTFALIQILFIWILNARFCHNQFKGEGTHDAAHVDDDTIVISSVMAVNGIQQKCVNWNKFLCK